MRNREFLMLAEKTPLEELSLGNWYMSEKLDGVRALWLPRTRGVPLEKIRFANLDRKSVLRTGAVATGLWSRYANIIHAPGWWLDTLPDIPLDGELYIGRGQFQPLTGLIKSYANPKDWTPVQYMVFDTPSYSEVFRPGKIHNPNYKKIIEGPEWIGPDIVEPRFEFRYNLLRQMSLSVLEQKRLHFRPTEAFRQAVATLEAVIKKGGEGIVLRAPQSGWEPVRSKLMVKVKALNDSEGTVIRYNPGQGRLLGMAGSIQVKWGDVTFDLSGFTDQERRDAKELFPPGTVITFSYRETTTDGKPKEARYLRKRDPGL